MMRMFHKASRGVMMTLASCLALIAVVFVNAPSVLYVYQGDVPEELLK